MIVLKSNSGGLNNNFINLTWSNSSDKEFNYTVHRRKVSDSLKIKQYNEEFKPIGMNSDYNISVLNLHPNCGDIITFNDYTGATVTIRESEMLQKWIYEHTDESSNGYGLGKINIHSKSISEFNIDPSEILFNQNETAKYDVVCIGFYDTANYTNKAEQFTETSLNIIKKYINDGYGVILGHDILSSYFGTQSNLGPIRDLFDIKLGQGDNNKESSFDYDFPFSYRGNKLKVEKPGGLIIHPWYIGSIADEIDISESHTSSQLTLNSDIWLSFVTKDVTGEENLNEYLKMRANSYLSTFKSTSLIQIGNNFDITNIEKKILVNLIFHSKQITKDKFYVDKTYDDENPSIPIINNYYLNEESHTATFDYRAEDIGVIVQYYVQAKNIATGEKEISNIVEVLFSSGIKCYKYQLNQIPIQENEEKHEDYEWIETTDRVVISEELKKGYYKFKIIAIDNSLNKSDMKEITFFMPGTVAREKSKASIRYPNAKVLNNRYRGPHESVKANNVMLQARANLNTLRKIINKLDEDKLVMLERPIVSNSKFIEYINVINKLEESLR